MLTVFYPGHLLAHLEIRFHQCASFLAAARWLRCGHAAYLFARAGVFLQTPITKSHAYVHHGSAGARLCCRRGVFWRYGAGNGLRSDIHLHLETTR